MSKNKNKCKKKRLCFTVCIICIASMFLGVISAEAYVSKTIAGYYRSDFVSGIAEAGVQQVLNAGIGYNISSYHVDASAATFKKSLQNREVVLLHSHGSTGYVTLSSTEKVYGTTVASWTDTLSAKLLYLSACKAGAQSSTYGFLPYELTKKGVRTVVSFKENISASSTTNGIHQFNLIAITNMTQGYTVSQSMALAYTTFRGMCTSGNYWGADSYQITGYGDYYLRHT